MLQSPHFTAIPQESDWPDSVTACAVSDPLLSHHEIEHSIWRELQSVPGVHFSSLTVRRVRDGVCLQGIMEAVDNDSAPDICGLVRQIAQIENVVNQLLVREAPRLPR